MLLVTHSHEPLRPQTRVLSKGLYSVPLYHELPPPLSDLEFLTGHEAQEKQAIPSILFAANQVAHIHYANRKSLSETLTHETYIQAKKETKISHQQFHSSASILPQACGPMPESTNVLKLSCPVCGSVGNRELIVSFIHQSVSRATTRIQDRHHKKAGTHPVKPLHDIDHWQRRGRASYAPMTLRLADHAAAVAAVLGAAGPVVAAGQAPEGFAVGHARENHLMWWGKAQLLVLLGRHYHAHTQGGLRVRGHEVVHCNRQSKRDGGNCGGQSGRADNGLCLQAWNHPGNCVTRRDLLLEWRWAWRLGRKGQGIRVRSRRGLFDGLFSRHGPGDGCRRPDLAQAHVEVGLAHDFG